MLKTTEPRKARIDSAFDIHCEGEAPVSVAKGECWIAAQDADVEVHLGAKLGQQVIRMPTAQYRQLLSRRQLVFLSW